MAFDWKEAIKGGLMSKEQFSKYQDRKYEEQKTGNQREYDLMKMLYQNQLSGNRQMELAEAQHGYRKKEIDYRAIAEGGKRAEDRARKVDDNLYQRFDMTKDEYLQRNQVPHWVPRGKEADYSANKPISIFNRQTGERLVLRNGRWEKP